MSTCSIHPSLYSLPASASRHRNVIIVKGLITGLDRDTSRSVVRPTRTHPVCTEP
jgi:hypothetical protein